MSFLNKKYQLFWGKLYLQIEQLIFFTKNRILIVWYDYVAVLSGGLDLDLIINRVMLISVP
jgi:hypothetical protein